MTGLVPMHGDWRGGSRLDGWGGRIRTFECRNQNPVPYHLATPPTGAGTILAAPSAFKRRPVRSIRPRNGAILEAGRLEFDPASMGRIVLADEDHSAIFGLKTGFATAVAVASPHRYKGALPGTGE